MAEGFLNMLLEKNEKNVEEKALCLLQFKPLLRAFPA